MLESGKASIVCPFPRCNTKIISFTQALYDSRLRVDNAPPMLAIDQKELQQEDALSGTGNLFYRVNDVWDFDNIGVSRPSQDPTLPLVDNETLVVERLLICSECDRGPIGFAGVAESQENNHHNLKYFISCNSLLYKSM